MSDFKEKLSHARSKLFRRTSSFSPATETSTTASTPSSSPRKNDQHLAHIFTKRKSSTPGFQSSTTPIDTRPQVPPLDTRLPTSGEVAAGLSRTANVGRTDSTETKKSPILTIESPTPETTLGATYALPTIPHDTLPHPLSSQPPDSPPLSPNSRSAEQDSLDSYSLQKSPGGSNTKTVDTHQTVEDKTHYTGAAQELFGGVLDKASANMSRRKIWIKRAGASATLVQIAHDDLVDDVRDMVLRKYANSLGRNFDAPDVALRIVPRERSQPERVLSPEEPMSGIIDAYFPGGQSIEEALLIDVPRKRTPLPSPRIMNYNSTYLDDNRPVENGTGYFPPMPAASPHPSHSAASHDSRHSFHQESHPHSISVVETGQLPALPSPRERRGHHRPKYSRQHTSSPTVMATSGQPVNKNVSLASRQQYSRMENESRRPDPPALPTPPAQEVTSKALPAKASTPPLDRIVSPRQAKGKKPRKATTLDLQHQEQEQQQQQQQQQEAQVDRKNSQAHHPMPFSLIEATVPPINVLIVEDNPINLRLLEMFTKRLKVRWQTAMNGRDAVIKWRAGGFHLVLMDIQLPIMSGLEATKEIRRLERVNGIGVFAKSREEGEEAAKAPSAEGDADSQAAEIAKGDDKLSDEGLFKSPVIIVALTASSLQSDRHEALAAGCNDFLTKPVHFPWLERKVMEWGCMQALIDFDGWRKWKDLAAAADEEKKKEEDLDPALKAKREKKEAKRAAIMAKLGQG